MRTAAIVLVVVILLCLVPMASAFLASAIAHYTGCTLNEADVHPCVVLGTDIGGALYTAFVAGWFMLLTFPLAILTSLAFIPLGIVALWRRHRARS